MALSSLALRRALAGRCLLLLRQVITAAAPSPLPSLHRLPGQLIPSHSFQSSSPLSNRRFDYGNESNNKIDPNEILFEGCDYNHWLITMDFPKDPAPTREEMIETYIQTLAKVVGSVEEAKKRMYALSTTTYHGFQAVMTEEMSEKFRGLPGVVFILPDSYIDPQNKEYGGDKYENGVITPRPPPVQASRRPPRQRYENRNDRPYDNRPPAQGNMRPDQQGMMQGDRQNYAPQQNYSPHVQDGNRGFRPGDSRGPMPSNQRDFQGNHGNFAPRDQINSGQENQGNFAPHDHRNLGSAAHGDNVRPPSYGNDRQGPGPVYGPDYRQQQTPGYHNSYGQGGNPAYSGDNRQGGFEHQGSNSTYGQQNYSGPPQGQQNYPGPQGQQNYPGSPQGQQNYSGTSQGQPDSWQRRQ